MVKLQAAENMGRCAWSQAERGDISASSIWYRGAGGRPLDSRRPAALL